jgi:hypothetical protein
MPVLTLPASESEAQTLPPEPSRPGTPLNRYFSRLFELTAKPLQWDAAAFAALASLVLLWVVRFYTTWATWGYLPVDVGRELYVPAMLAKGQTLYRDVWFGYTPLAPYLNSFLFRAFGTRLEVFYWAGSLAALACSLLLFLTGRKLGSQLAGWTAGAIVLMEAFHAWHFSFPLPYSFSSVYGYLTGCVFLWFALQACRSSNSFWMLAAGTLAAVALLAKLEYGAACFATYALLAAARAWRDRSVKQLLTDAIALVPGFILLVAVAAWMLSLGGFAFLTQENLASTWPGSFFMKNYGPAWMETTGLAINGKAILQSISRTLFFCGLIAEGYLLFWRRRFSTATIAVCVAIFAGLATYATFAFDGDASLKAATALFFPQDMVLYVAIAAILTGWWFVRKNASKTALPLGILLAFAALVAIRTLLRTIATGYPVFYNGPAVLSFLILVRPLVPRASLSRRAILRSELLLCLGPLAVVSVYAARFAAEPTDRTPLVTERGTILASTQTTEQYRAAIDLMKKEAAAGRMVLSVPEDTSLYFLSGTEAPARLYFFAPGMLVPGKMTATIIREIEQKPVRYIIWSNRKFAEYGVPQFGVDFDQEFGKYLTSHYHLIGPLLRGSFVDWHVRFDVWERNASASSLR